jgi:hypothetical protein
MLVEVGLRYHFLFAKRPICCQWRILESAFVSSIPPSDLSHYLVFRLS